MKNPGFPDMLCISREFLPVDRKIIPPFKAGIYSHFHQDIQNGLGEFPEIHKKISLAALNECEIQVSKIVKYCASSRQPSDHWNIIMLNVFNIYLSQCILVLADNNAWGVSP
jgi:hypothetical protein